MCTNIVAIDGTHIETVEELEKHFKLDATPFLLHYYKKLTRESCLCQIDLDACLEGRKFEKGFLNWREIKE